MGGLYNYRWQLAREAYLYAHPLCLYCTQEGRTTEASVVDHITPHKGDTSLFWNKANWQALCAACHNSTKQRQETTGKRQGTSLSGEPVDPAHHWFT